MQNWPALSRPPVQEAILEFKFRLPNNIKDENLESFCQAANNKFPDKKLRFAINLSGQFKPIEGKEPQIPEVKTSRIHDGYMLSSEDRKTVIQISPIMFSYHIIEMYRNWPALIEEAKEMWAIFSKHISGIQVVNTSLRYLNKIELNEEQISTGIDKFFKLLPNIPIGIPNDINSFFMQLNIPDETNELLSIINFSAEPPFNNIHKFMLDISVLRSTTGYEGTDTKIWDDVSRLRDFKNQIFFNSITESTIKMYV